MTGASSSYAWKAEVERDLLERKIGSGDGCKVCCLLGAREGMSCENLKARFRGLSGEEAEGRSRLTSRWSKLKGCGEDDFRFFRLGGLESGEELEDGEDECCERRE
jgi:hypothetical protein